MNNNTTSNDGNLLSPEEADRLRSLIGMAYPAPKTNLRAAVVAQIRGEQRRRRRIRRFLRYGSAAACLVLILGVVAVVSPLLNDRFDAAVEEEADNGELCAMIYTADEGITPGEGGRTAELMTGYLLDEDAASTTGGMGQGEEGQPEEEAAADASVPETSARTTNGTAATEATAAEAATAEESVIEAAGTDLREKESAVVSPLAQSLGDDTFVYVADNAGCTVHDADTHRFCDALILHVGADAFDAWYESGDGAEDCGIPSVDNMVGYFAISRDTFDRLTAESGVSYDLHRIFPEED